MCPRGFPLAPRWAMVKAHVAVPGGYRLCAPGGIVQEAPKP